MARLSNADLGTLLEGIKVLNSDPSVESLPNRLFDAITLCVQVEFTALDGWGKSGEYKGELWYDPSDWVTPELTEAFGAYASEHPLVAPLIFRDYPGALKISDFLTKAQFERTGLFSEFYREIGVGEQLIAALDISPDWTVSCALSRDRRNFSERDRAMFDMLKPHLINAFRNGNLIRQVSAERDYARSVATKGVIALDIERKVQFIDGIASRLLRKYFRDVHSDLLPEDIRDFVTVQSRSVNGNEYGAPPSALVVKDQHSELLIQLVFDLERGEIRLILDEKRDLSPGDFLKLGFTKREADVLY